MNLLTEKQQLDLIEELVKAYSQKKESNASFSMRAFSKRIQVSSGALSEILKNKRRVTLETAKKILANLNYCPLEVDLFLERPKKAKGEERQFQNLTLDQYQVLSSWQYFALLNLLELPDESHDAHDLAKRLNLPVHKIEDAIDRLLRLEMIEKKGERYVRTFVRYQTTEDISSSAIRRYHHETIHLSEKSLREVAPTERDFSSIVLKMNPRNLKKLKELIRQFQDDVADMMEKDEPEEIYHLNMHVYPVTKNKNQKSKMINDKKEEREQ